VKSVRSTDVLGALTSGQTPDLAKPGFKIGNLIRWSRTAPLRRPDQRTGVGPCLVIDFKQHTYGVNTMLRYHLLVGEEIITMTEKYVRDNYEVIS